MVLVVFLHFGAGFLAYALRYCVRPLRRCFSGLFSQLRCLCWCWWSLCFFPCRDRKDEDLPHTPAPSFAERRIPSERNLQHLGTPVRDLSSTPRSLQHLGTPVRDVCSTPRNLPQLETPRNLQLSETSRPRKFTSASESKFATSEPKWWVSEWMRRVGSPLRVEPSPTSGALPGFSCLTFGFDWVRKNFTLRWYWFHLATQVAFMIREFLVINELKGWTVDVLAAHAAIWLTLMVVVYEVWLFSAVRNKDGARETVDGVLDMLLLPANIGFFSEVCVRMLRLQPHISTSRIEAVIEAADIWEALALWSVLILFVKVVDIQSQRDTQATAAYFEAIRAFKLLSLQGVQTWVVILSSVASVNLLLKGWIAVFMPTLCYKVQALMGDLTCHTCEEWYEQKLQLAITIMNFILCSFALVFVFSFELSFKDYLHDINPFWKFWGVKGVVSVTYFQWLVIKFCSGFSNREKYSVHVLLCALEMPFLSGIHLTCAYPFGKPWMYCMLDYCSQEEDQIIEKLPEKLPTPRELFAENSVETSSDARSTPTHDYSEHPALGSRRQAHGQWRPNAAVFESYRQQLLESLSFFGFAFPWLLLCYICTRLLLWILPVEAEIGPPEPVKVLTCGGGGGGDLAYLLESTRDEHFRLLPETRFLWHYSEGDLTEDDEWSGAGAKLPLCISMQVGCAAGYVREEDPKLQCLPNGSLILSGVCKAATCGAPPWIKDAEVIDYVSPRKTFATETIQYRCTFGARYQPPGTQDWYPFTNEGPTATCGANGVYEVSGECVPIFCIPPPELPHAVLVDESLKGEKQRFHSVVEYKCVPPYMGRLMATCIGHSRYNLQGDCKLDCGSPPELPHAKERSDPASIGDLEILYDCEPGFYGNPRATCGASLRYTVQGACLPLCGSLGKSLEVGGDGIVWDSRDDATLNGTYGEVRQLLCVDGWFGRPLAVCMDGGWRLLNGCRQQPCPPLASWLTPAFSGPIGIVPDLRGQEAYNISRSGALLVPLTCSRGLSGRPMAVCIHGAWSVRGECLARSCRDLGAALDEQLGLAWKERMSLATTAARVGDVLAVECLPGLIGRVFALCAAEQKTAAWRVQGEGCRLHPTASGCSCKRKWRHCSGTFWGSCRTYYGCGPSGRCEVEPGSCGMHSRPLAWDRCQLGSAHVSDADEDSPQASSISRLLLPLVLSAGFVAALLSWRRHVGRQRAARLTSMGPTVGALEPEGSFEGVSPQVVTHLKEHAARLRGHSPPTPPLAPLDAEARSTSDS